MSQRTHTLRWIIIATLLLAGCGGLKVGYPLKIRETDWPMFARTETRINATSEAVVPPLSVEWQYDVSGGIGTGSPLIVDSVLIVGNMRGELHAINSFTGRRLGWLGLGDAIEGSPIIDAGDAIVAISNSRQSLVSVELATGRIMWKMEYGDIVSTPLLLQQKIYVGNISGKFFCIKREDGDLVWTFTIPENTRYKGIRSSPAGYANTIVFGADDGALYALDAGTGSRRWSFVVAAPIVASPAIADSSVFVGAMDGVFYAIDLSSGKLRWTFPAGTSIYASAAVANDMVLIGTTGGTLFALNKIDGSMIWKTELESVINAGAVISGAIVYVGALNKYLYGLTTSDGKIVWKYEMRGRIKTPPAVANGRLYVATDDRYVTAFHGSGL